MKEKKRSFLILSSLGVVALLLLILSFGFNNEEAEEPETEIVEEPSVEEVSDEETLEEESSDEDMTEEESSDEVIEEEPLTENLEDDERGMTLQEIGAKREAEKLAEELAENTKLITSKKYVSEDYRISFEVPAEWIGKVSVIEIDLRMAFFYKEEHEFLNFIFVGKGKYAHDSSYYDAMYRKILDIDRYHLFYAPVGEHPLYDQEGSDDYNELTQFIYDVESVVETVEVLD